MKKHILILLICFISSTIYSQDKVRIKNLPINSKYSDFGVAFYKDNQIIFASSRAKRGLVDRKWKPNNQPYLNLYKTTAVIRQNDSTAIKSKIVKEVVKRVKGKKQEQITDDIVNFSKEINTKYHESSVAFSPDYTTIYFTRDKYLDGKLAKPDATGRVVLNLYKATNVGGKWTNIEALPFNSHLYSTGHPTVSKDGKTLYFTSDMPGGLGETDIYKVEILGNNTYSKPVNLGAKINTKGKEMFPFIDENNVLYFSSNGREDSMGGLDIYAATQNNSGEFKKVTHFKHPMNSVADDFAFVKAKGKNSGYFSSNRYGGHGDDDIYAFEGITIKKECKSVINGTVIDKASKQVIANATVKVYDSGKKMVNEFITDAEGKFTMSSPCKLTYKVNAEKVGYQKATKTITTKEGEIALEISPEKNVVVEEVVVQAPNILSEADINYDDKGRLVINIENIYYDTAKHNIRYSERPKLDRLIEIMNKYPDIRVEIGAHTDCRGKASYNMRLSDRRAKSARKYVIEGGIQSNRIFGRGYGEGNPVNDCDCRRKCTQQEYQANRRTEFVIINR